MKLMRLTLVLLAGAVLAGVAYVNQATEPAVVKMADAAEKFLASLTPEQKKAASFAFDDKERLNWHFVPLQDKEKKSTRKGVPLEQMTPVQKAAALQLVKAGMSAEGYVEATAVMALEGVLRELEKKGAMVRNPDWYFFSIFGTPSRTGQWGWRVEGHHLSLNFTMDKGEVVSATPAFLGANPAVIKSGPRKGQKTLANSQVLAAALWNSLDEGQKKTALQEKQFPEIAGKTTAPKLGEPTGIAGAKLNEQQREQLYRLIESYAQRLAPDIAAAQLAQVKKDGLDKVYFGLAGSPEQGKPYTYRVQGPSFAIEFINTQNDSAGNPANHIHSAWRNPKGDFGLTK